MAELAFPINVNLPDDWKEQILERIKQDGDWVCVIRCRECIHVGHDIWDRGAYCNYHKIDINDDDFCSYAEEYTMEEFMQGQDLGNPEDGSL